LNASHLGWTLQKNQKAGFRAEIQVSKLPDLQVVRCLCQPCSGFRGKREIAAGGVAYYGLLLLHKGQEEVTVGSRTALLEPGNILLWDSTEPIRFKLHSPVYKTTVLVPQTRMDDALPQTRNLVGKTMDWRQGLGAVAAAHIAALCAQASHIQHLQAHPAAETALMLIATSLGSQEPWAGESVRQELTDRIKTHIESNLDDPALGPRTLAERFGISIRYLHLLFAKEEHTLSRWILERRLERCRRDLMVVGPHKNITETAFAWGFNDGAHFSRVFKKRYGVSPREYRRSKILAGVPRG
jgi:AraC-like DNA-binding protein